MDTLNVSTIVAFMLSAIQDPATLDTVFTWVKYALTAVGIASVVSKAVVEITKITPNTKDDEYASKLAVFVSHVVAFLDKVALGLPSSKARK